MMRTQSERPKPVTMLGIGLAVSFGLLAACGGGGETGVATTGQGSEPTGVTTTETDSAVPEESAPETPAPTTSVDVPVVELEWPEPNNPSGSFGSGNSFSILSALAQIPLEVAINENGQVEVHVADLLAASEVSGHPRPTGSVDVDEAVEWLGPLVGGNDSIIFVPIPFDLKESTAALAEYKDEIGFSITDVDASIEVLQAPNSLKILTDELEHASSVEVVEGVYTFGEGEDFSIDFDNQTIARALGRPLRVASRDDLVLLSPSTDVAQLWFDQAVPTLDSMPALASVAQALDRQGVVGASLFQTDFSALAHMDQAEATEAGVVITEPFSTVGLGWSAVNGEGILSIVYGFDDAQAASAMAPTIETMFLTYHLGGKETPLVELVNVELVEAQGEVVIVSMRMLPGFNTPDLMLNMLYQRDVTLMFLPQ